MVLATNLGYPRMGAQRQLKRALERYWAGKHDAAELERVAASLRLQHWALQREQGIAHIPSGDFSLYDHVLDTAAMVGAVPARFGFDGGEVDLTTYFAMARGTQEKHAEGGSPLGPSAPAMEMTKWFDTNYHYIVPEFEKRQRFHLASDRPVREFREALAAGVVTRPVLLGPVTFLLLGKAKDPSLAPLSLLDELVAVYAQLLGELGRAGADWVQLDEPCLVLDLGSDTIEALHRAYGRIARAVPGLRILLTTYFGDLGENLDEALRVPVAGLHLDLVRAPEQLARALPQLPDDMVLSLGLVNGRNVWKTDLDRALELARAAVTALGSERVFIGPSCPLLHSPVDVELETGLDDELRSWMAFANQKLGEITVLATALTQGEAAVRGELQAHRQALAARARSPRCADDAVRRRAAGVNEDMLRRTSPYAERRRLQRQRLGLPLFPTTTIGSFPQTGEVRRARNAFRKGETDTADYQAFLQDQVARAIRIQEEIGLDVLVHGESERSDMVEYFGERLEGFAVTQHGWVQSYGSRCVKPPVIFGDVSRPSAMTVAWSRYAQSLTERPVKGMLTGPVTLLRWSFVRDDQPASETCHQIALAMRDEVLDLEAAGIGIIQVDEPALREGLPLRRAEWDGYLKWAVDAFRLASSGVRDETQIHSHMCYSEFNDIIEAIGQLDADVVSIEASRSQMELLSSFQHYRYPNDIGPGIYDIHSPDVPTAEAIHGLLRKALRVLEAEQVWVNPDCGLKTRRWSEVRPALRAMVEAARRLRADYRDSP